jgi:acetoin:2,6-dichlorophenolindophenol oxidoreductase subunit beta
MAQKTFATAMLDALGYALQEDVSVAVVGAWSFIVDRGLPRDQEKAFFERYGDRLIDPPTSESVIAAMATGAAVCGLRPFVNFGTSSFAFEAWNQIINETGNARFMSNGQLKAPLVYHMFCGVRGGGAAQHSQSPQSMFANAPGLEVVLPATPADAQGLLRTAIRSDNPTLFLTHTKLLHWKGETPDGDFAIPFGKAEVKRAGRDVTVVATSLMVREALAASETLAKEGVEIEIVDPRTVVPLDAAAICASVEKTGRLVVVDEAVATCSIASEIVTVVAENALHALKAPPVRVARPSAPLAYAPTLEKAVTPDADKIVAAVRRLLKK